MPAGVEHRVPQSPKLTRKHWGPSRRYAPHGAHSTPAPATRDGVTARLIQPRRRASLATVAERRGRPMARPVRPRPPTAGASPTPRRALDTEIPRPRRDAQPATPPTGLTSRARTGVRPRGGSLPPSDEPDPRTVLPGAMAGPTPSVGNPTTSVVGGCQPTAQFCGLPSRNERRVGENLCDRAGYRPLVRSRHRGRSNGAEYLPNGSKMGLVLPV